MDEKIVSSWDAAKGGLAVGSNIDRVVNRPQVVFNPAVSFGMDQNGNLYQLGQYGASGSDAISGGGSRHRGLWMLLAIAAVVIIAKG